MGVVGLVLLTEVFPIITNYPVACLVYIFFYAVVMITTIPFPSFKKSPWVQKHKKSTFLIILSTLFLLFTYEKVMVFINVTTYMVLSLIHYIIKRNELGDVFELEEESNA